MDYFDPLTAAPPRRLLTTSEPLFLQQLGDRMDHLELRTTGGS
jgi:hypothetical protein